MTHRFLVPNSGPDEARPSAANGLESEPLREADDLTDMYLKRLQPINIVEEYHVEQMARCRWRSRRFWRMEGEMLDALMEQQITPEDGKTKAVTSLKTAAKIHDAACRRHKRNLEALLELRASGIFTRAAKLSPQDK